MGGSKSFNTVLIWTNNYRDGSAIVISTAIVVLPLLLYYHYEFDCKLETTENDEITEITMVARYQYSLNL